MDLGPVAVCSWGLVVKSARIARVLRPTMSGTVDSGLCCGGTHLFPVVRSQAAGQSGRTELLAINNWAMGQSGRMAVAQQGRAVRQLGSRNLMHAQCEFLVWWRQLSRDLRWSAKVWSRQEVEFLLEGLVDVKVTCDMFFVVTCCVGCHVNDDQVGGQLRVPG